MSARLFLIAAFFVALCGAGATRDGAAADGVSARQTVNHATLEAASPLQTGYCQVYGCIDMPSSGYCPPGYYRFQGTWCCCPINRRPPDAGPRVVLASAAQPPAPKDFSMNFLRVPVGYGRARCGRS